LIGAALCVLANSAFARTWYVTADGSGDAPSVEAALDSTVSGDTVLAGEGVHEVRVAIFMRDGVTLLSEHGPYYTRLVPKPFSYPPVAIRCADLVEETRIEGFWIEGFRFGVGGGGAIVVSDCRNLYIRNNVLIDNDDGGIAMYGNIIGLVYIEHNTIVAVRPYTYTIIDDGERGYVTNNILWGPTYGLYLAWQVLCNCMTEWEDSDNMVLDPEFCGTIESGNLFLQSDSPCVAGNAPAPWTDCGHMGALPVGCATTPVTHTTWGALKSIYE
jgi:hypothetical protein